MKPLHTTKAATTLAIATTILAVIGGLVFALPVYAATDTAVRQGYKIEYPVTTHPLNIAVQAPGRIWFTAPDSDTVSLLEVTSAPGATPITYATHVVSLAEQSRPYDLVFANNTIWFTERGANKIGRIDVTNVDLNNIAVQEYTIPTANSAPTGIAVAPNGLVWFTESQGNKVASFDPNESDPNIQFTEYPYPDNLYHQLDGKGAAEDVTVADNDTIWFTVPADGAVGVYKVGQAKFLRIPTGANSRPNNLVTDVTGLPWVTASGTNLLGRYFFGTISVWAWYTIPTPSSEAAGVTFVNHGSIWEVWYAENATGKVGRMTIQSNGKFIRMEEITLASNGQPWGVGKSSDDHIWIADTGRAVIYELIPPYLYYQYFPFISRQP